MTKEQAYWSPYDSDGGTCVVIACADYCVVAADTRMSSGYNILTRDSVSILNVSIKQMSTHAVAQLLSNTLYYKRFFPYVAFNVLGGLDGQVKGSVFTYDAVGSCERVGYSSQGSGSGSTLIMPFLDNHLKSPSPLLLQAKDAVTPLSQSEAIDLVDLFCFCNRKGQLH